MANSRTLAKHRVHHPSKAPCLHPAKVFRLSKNKKERALSFSGKLPAPSILLNFFETWEREAAPAVLLPDIAAIYGHLLSEFAAKNNGRR
jgi:hypothetical protein